MSKQGTTVSLVYTPHGSVVPVDRRFEGLDDTDITFILTGLAGRHMRTPQRFNEDLEQIGESYYSQMSWYADEMVMALYGGLGWWKRLLPMQVRVRIVQKLMELLRDITSSWTGELIGLHAEIARRPQPVIRPRPAAEPLIPCRCCGASFERADFLPEGWTADDDGWPRCPAHRVVTLVKENAA
jgi:hypothetical protein